MIFATHHPLATGLLASWTDVYIAIIATLGVVIAGIAAYFAYAGWREQRRRPSLALGTGGPQTHQNRNDPGVWDVYWNFELDNQGNAPARHWKLSLQPPPDTVRSFSGLTDQKGYSVREWNVGQDPILLQIVLEWSAVDAADVILPGRPLLIPCRAQVPDDTEHVCEYAIAAEGMESKTGTITLRHASGHASLDA